MLPLRFYVRVMLCCTHRPHLVFPFIGRWTLGWFPPSGCSEQCCSVHWCTRLCLETGFRPLGLGPRSGIDSSYGELTFHFLRNCQTVFLKWLHHVQWTFQKLCLSGSDAVLKKIIHNYLEKPLKRSSHFQQHICVRCFASCVQMECRGS